MSIKKNFECDSCNAVGSITIKSKEFDENDVRVCPICGTPILESDDEDED